MKIAHRPILRNYILHMVTICRVGRSAVDVMIWTFEYFCCEKLCVAFRGSSTGHAAWGAGITQRRPLGPLTGVRETSRLMPGQLGQKQTDSNLRDGSPCVKTVGQGENRRHDRDGVARDGWRRCTWLILIHNPFTLFARCQFDAI